MVNGFLVPCFCSDHTVYSRVSHFLIFPNLFPVHGTTYSNFDHELGHNSYLFLIYWQKNVLAASQSVKQGFCFRDFIVCSIAGFLQGSAGKALKIFSHLVFLNKVQYHSFVVWWVTQMCWMMLVFTADGRVIAWEVVWSQYGQNGRISFCRPVTELIYIMGPSQAGDTVH